MSDDSNSVPASDAFGLTRFGLKHDPTGAHVVYMGKPWDCSGAEYREFPSGAIMLRLISFNRERIVSAPLSQCRVLLRDYPEV